MSLAVQPFTQPSWSVRPMSVDQIPLVVSWIADLDPTREMDQIGLVEQMTRELAAAEALGFPEYFMGYFEQLPAFMLILATREAAEIELATLLMNPDILRVPDLFLFYNAIRFIFGRGDVSKVIYQIQRSNVLYASILLQLGFEEVSELESAASHQWFRCNRDAFIALG